MHLGFESGVSWLVAAVQRQPGVRQKMSSGSVEQETAGEIHAADWHCSSVFGSFHLLNCSPSHLLYFFAFGEKIGATRFELATSRSRTERGLVRRKLLYRKYLMQFYNSKSFPGFPTIFPWFSSVSQGFGVELQNSAEPRPFLCTCRGRRFYTVPPYYAWIAEISIGETRERAEPRLYRKPRRFCYSMRRNCIQIWNNAI